MSLGQCCAPVLLPEMIRHRSSRDLSPRCQRTAQIRLRCHFGYRDFCHPHARIWQEHNAIVERILAIPPRRVRCAS